MESQQLNVSNDAYLRVRSYMTRPLNTISKTLTGNTLSDATAPYTTRELLIGLLALLLCTALLLPFRKRQKYKLPPRIPGVPIFGNSFQVPAIQQGPWAQKLAEKYGEMSVAPDRDG